MRETKIKNETVQICRADAPVYDCRNCGATELECLQFLLGIAKSEQNEKKDEQE